MYSSSSLTFRWPEVHSDITKLPDSVPEIDAQSKEGKVLDSKVINGHLRFDNVDFRYRTRPTTRVLHDLSFEVEPGTFIALVGASGSGKSTTPSIQLIERFYEERYSLMVKGPRS